MEHTGVKACNIKKIRFDKDFMEVNIKRKIIHIPVYYIILSRAVRSKKV